MPFKQKSLLPSDSLSLQPVWLKPMLFHQRSCPLSLWYHTAPCSRRSVQSLGPRGGGEGIRSLCGFKYESCLQLVLNMVIARVSYCTTVGKAQNQAAYLLLSEINRFRVEESIIYFSCSIFADVSSLFYCILCLFVPVCWPKTFFYLLHIKHKNGNFLNCVSSEVPRCLSVVSL